MSYLQNLRAAQAEVNQHKAQEQANLADAEAKRRVIEGENLTEILTFLGFEFSEPLLENKYTVDGFTFYYQAESDHYAYGTPGYYKNIKEELSFRLVVVKDTPYNETVEDFRWDCSGDVIGREVDVTNTASQTIWRADLANLLDQLNKQYESRLPEYQRALEQAQARKAELDHPHTFVFTHTGGEAGDHALCQWVDQGYRVIQMNTVIGRDGLNWSYILLSKHPKIVPVTHTTHFHGEV